MITIEALLQRAELDLTLLAGAGSTDRIVTWAHAVDLPDPWRWVHSGDLVMTTGAGLPEGHEDQVDWMTLLVGSRATGLVLAPRPGAPHLADAALAVAESHHFPVLGAGFELEFSHLAHVVIESALDTQRQRLARSERLFSVYAAALRDGGSLGDRLRTLGTRFGWHLRVDVHPPSTASSATTSDAATGEVSMAVPGRTRATLVARQVDPARSDRVVDPILVSYLVGLLGIELEREAIERDHARTSGEALFDRILGGAVDFVTARDAMDQRGLGDRTVIAAFRPAGAGEWSDRDVHHLPAMAGRRPLLRAGDHDLLAVLSDDEHLVDSVRLALGAKSVVGVSSLVTATTGLEECVRQARLALSQALETGLDTVRYASARAVSLLPDTVEENRALAVRYLQPLLEYDASNRSDLVGTLAAFLAADGSWKRTSEELHVHRQTLVYRLKLVEQLTGVKPSTTQGTTSLWLALAAARASGLIDT